MKKRFSGCLVLLLAVLLAVSGCAQKQSTPGLTASPTASATAQPTQTPAPPAPTPAQADLVTSGGAVLVGKVALGQDGKCCLKLDAPLNIELSGTQGSALFSACAEILFYDTAVDGIDKTAYEDMDVTIRAVLQSGDADGALYAYVCYIEAERTAEACRADETIRVGQTTKWVSDYDASVPVPEKVQPLVRDGAYAYNPYAISREALRHFGSRYPAFFTGLVDAFMNYETSCACPEAYYANMFDLIVMWEFPIFQADGVIGDVVTYNEADHTLNWTYQSTSRAQHDRILTDFEREMNRYLNEISPADTEIARARQLYHAFSGKMNYDEAATVTRKGVEAYHAILDQSGICGTFANAYSYLLTMAGVESTVVEASIQPGADGDEGGHVWNAVTMGGQTYFCDPTFEAGTNAGKGYLFFGTTLEERLHDGTKWLPDTTYIGRYDKVPAAQAALAQTRLPLDQLS
ncbi:MAG: transglutaminase-like domain-containing protein [Eubacteriales bacterium]|nr:transglutaminase-like domain-containing protein [Eubacteriales bacterium]